MSFSQGTWGATKAVAVVSGTPFPTCRALKVGTAGTATLTYGDGTVATDYPLIQGYNLEQVVTVTFGTAADVWALY